MDYSGLGPSIIAEFANYKPRPHGRHGSAHAFITSTYHSLFILQ